MRAGEVYDSATNRADTDLLRMARVASSGTSSAYTDIRRDTAVATTVAARCWLPGLCRMPVTKPPQSFT